MGLGLLELEPGHGLEIGVKGCNLGEWGIFPSQAQPELYAW